MKYGMALFGNQFQTDLAKALDVNDRTMRRWLSGETQIPEKVGNDVNVLIGVKLELLTELKDELFGRYIEKQNVLIFKKDKDVYRIYLYRKESRIWFSIYDYVSEHCAYSDSNVFHSFVYSDKEYKFNRARKECTDFLAETNVTFADIKNYLQENIDFSKIEENIEEYED